MTYWIKSCPPLISKKTICESMKEVMKWIDTIIRDTKKEFTDRKEIFEPKEKLDIFKKCFVLIKFDKDKNQDFHDSLKTNTDDEPDNITKKYLHIRKELDRLEKRKKPLGRRRKYAV
ncbi:hypothetical protein LCGC14_0803960 [marine sediment metagenome]|uniref:Uncharacterized protein n=1 Tax=marine sediment metagenome TaxID=412755 RepID=A0A0F9PTG1_9ZZZZ